MTSLVLTILNESSSFLHTIRTTIKAWISLNFRKIPSHILELAPLEHLKKLMNNVVTTLAHSFLIGSSSFWQATSRPIISRMGSKFSRIPPGTYELPALERLEKTLHTYNGRNIATTLVLSILNGSSSFLHTIRTSIKAWMSLNFVKIPSHIFYFGVSSP